MASPHPVRPRGMRWAGAGLLTVIALITLTLALSLALGHGRAAAGTPDTEILQFNHAKHVSAGVPCLFCHPGPVRGPTAGIPSLAKCVGCHQNIQVTTDTGQAQVDILMEHWNSGLPLRWPKVNDQPDFVSFTHRPHVAAGVACERCHGEVGQMAMARAAYRVNMGFCLACHTQQGADKQPRLTSCGTCHK